VQQDGRSFLEAVIGYHRWKGSSMPRSYYIFKSGRLRRKGNTLYWERSDFEVSDSDRAMDLSTPEPDVGTTALESAAPPPPTDTPSATDSPATAAVSPARRIIPIEDVSELFLFGELSLNTRLLHFLAQKGIPVHVFNYHGFYSGSYYPRETNVSGHLLVKQVQHYTDADKRLALAREIARGACHNLRRNILYYRNRGKTVQDALAALDQASSEIEQADSIPALMGAEGRLRDAYYRAFNQILQLETPFLRRVRRPPDNLVNALISFGNSLLYAAVLAQIYRTPLHPTISFLHEPGTRRFSLALDLAEIFKPLVVDKMIFALVNRQMVGQEDLMPEVGFAVLKEHARKTVVQEFDRRLQTTVKHRRLGRHVSYRGFIRLECYKLVRHLLGMETYQALRAWW